MTCPEDRSTHTEADAPTVLQRLRARHCKTCNGWNPVSGLPRRETVGMVCPTCGWDYATWGEPR